MMTRAEILEALHTRFADDIVEMQDKSRTRLYIGIQPGAIRRLASYLFEELGARFNTASGIDCRIHLEILYHFTVEDLDLVTTLRVKLPKEEPEIDSLSPVFEAANWIEREMAEMLGVQFRGQPDGRRLLLSEDWPASVFPLRQDYVEWDPNAVRDRGV